MRIRFLHHDLIEILKFTYIVKSNRNDLQNITKMKITFIILLFVAFNSTDLVSNELYEGKIVLKNSIIINAERIFIAKDSVYYSDVETNNKYSISSDELNKLEVNDGTYKVLGLLTGGLVGFTSYYIIVPSDKFDTKESIYSAVVGLVLGGIIGEFTSKTSEIYFGKNLSMNIETQTRTLPFTSRSTYQTLIFTINL